MIETFILEEKCLALPDGDDHERFLRYWQSCGALIAAGGLSGSIWQTLVSNTPPPGVRNKYKQLRAHGWWMRASDGCASVHQFEDIGQLSAYVSAKHPAMTFFVAEAEGLYRDNSCDSIYNTREQPLLKIGQGGGAITLWEFSRADLRIDGIRSMHEEKIQAGGGGAAWKERLAPLARLSGRIIIVDRYAFTRRNIDGLVNLVRCIDLEKLYGADADECREVDVYAAYGGEIDEVKSLQEAHMIFEEKIDCDHMLCHGGIGKLRLYAVRDSDFCGLSHGRFMRFTRNHEMLGWVTTIDIGVEVMSQDNRRSCDFAVKRMPSVVADYQKVERELQRARCSRLKELSQDQQIDCIVWQRKANQ